MERGPRLGGEVTGKVALVTGGGSGIGRAICERFAREGARVAVADWRREAAEETVARIVGEGGTAIATSGDVASPDDAERMVAETVAAFGRLDVLVANAGQALVATRRRDDARAVGADHRHQPDRLLLAGSGGDPAICIAAGGGSIVLTASQLAFVGAERFAAYAASKGGVLNLARALALDHARDKIRVNALCPGAVETPLLLNQFAGQDGPQGTPGRPGGVAPVGAARAAGGDRRCRIIPGLGRGVVRDRLGAGGGRRLPGPLRPMTRTARQEGSCRGRGDERRRVGAMT